MGTPLYMSPEVLEGRGYEWKSDVWSLGCLLYELAALRSPFKSQSGAKDNLYSLFQKISNGEFAPLPSHYSSHLSELTKARLIHHHVMSRSSLFLLLLRITRRRL